MRISIVRIVPVVAATFLAGVNGAWADPLLKVDFGSGGSASPVQSGFLGMAGQVSQAADIQTFGAYTVGVEGNGYFATGGNAGNVDASVRSLYRDYYYNNSTDTGEGVILSIGGVIPNTQYNLTLWSYDADQTFTHTQTEWAPFDTSTGTSGSIDMFATPYPTTLAPFSTTIQVTSATDTLKVFGTTTSGFGGTRLNAFRLNDGGSDVLSIDFGQASQPASPVQATYTGISGSVSDPNFSQTIGPYGVTLTGQGFFNSGDANANLLDPSVRDFYRDYYYNNSTTSGEGVLLEIAGVAPNTDYDVTLWSYDVDNAIEATPTLWSPTGTTTGTNGTATNFQTPLPASLNDNRVTIRVRSTTSTLQIFGTTTGGTGGTRLNGFELNAVVTLHPGDFDGDGDVDGADFVAWQTNFPKATGATLADGDADGDGDVDGADFVVWQTNFPFTPGPGVAVVPEPPAWLLGGLAIGAMIVVGRRNRHSFTARG